MSRLGWTDNPGLAKAAISPGENMFLRRVFFVAVNVAICAASSNAALAREEDDDDDEGIEIRTLSTRADRVSGGDVLVEIANVREQRKHPLQITLNGRDVTAAFHPGNQPNIAPVQRDLKRVLA